MLSILIAFQFGCGSNEKRTSENNQLTETESTRLYVNPSLPDMSNLVQGDTLSIEVKDSEEIYWLKVRRVQETIPGIMSISAFVEDQQTGQATLIYRDGRLSGFMDMYKTNVRLQLEYDEDTKAYYLNEIDPDEIDELEGGEPLTPPNEEY